MELHCPVWSLSTNLAKAAGATTESNDQILERISAEVDAGNVSDSSYEDLSRILEQDPRNSKAHLLLGNCYDALGLPGEAYEQYELAFKYAPNDTKALCGAIKAELHSGRLALATQLIENGIKRFPDNPELKFWKGSLLYSQNKMNEAEVLFQEALNSQTKIFGLPTAMATIRFRQKLYSDAATLVKEDLKKEPNSVLANEVLGLSLMRMRLYSKAVKPLAVAFQGNPGKSIIAEEYAQALYWAGDYRSALKPALINLALSADLYSNDPLSKTILGRILLHVKATDLSEAIDNVSGRFGIDKNAAFHFALGDVLDRYGFRELAMKQYRKGLDLQPGFGRGWYRLALDLECVNHDYEQALACLRKASSLLPEDESVSRHLLRFEDRYNNYHKDWAWQIKDWLRTL